MSTFHFAHPWALALLAAGPGLAALFRYGDTRRRAALALFGAQPAPNRRRGFKRALAIASVTLIAVAVARPVESLAVPPAPSGDLVFLLDVSRSMLSRDAVPNRMRRAKQIAGETGARIAARPGGQRLGLIAFAGNAAVLCPLTIDQDYFREMLDSASPESVTRGGSRIGDALLFAAGNGFDDVRRGAKDLVLLTDGGNQDDDARQAVQALTRAGIRLTVIGVGDPDRSAPVPTSEVDPVPFFYNGAPVMTKLESAELGGLAGMGRGAYWEAGAGFDESAVVRRIAARSSAPADNAHEFYPLLLALAAALLAIEWMIADGVRLRTAAAGLIVPLALAAIPTPMRAQSAAEWIQRANDAFAIKQYEAAITCYRNAAAILPASPQLQFDIGVAYYRDGMYDAAAQAFVLAADRAPDGQLLSKSLLGEGNALFRSSDARALERNATAALRDLERAVELYAAAVAADPKSKDAAYNLEVAKKKLDEMKKRRRAQAAQDYATSTMRKEQPATSDPNEILKDAKGKRVEKQIPRRAVSTDW